MYLDDFSFGYFSQKYFCSKLFGQKKNFSKMQFFGQKYDYQYVKLDS